MPLWKIYTPAEAYTPEERRELAEKITKLHELAPLPPFYVVILFEQLEADSVFVGGKPHGEFVRIKIDHMARTMPDSLTRRWWLDTISQTITPYVQERGYDWEITIDEMPIDFWMINGEVPPPFESVAEKRWLQDNRTSPYTLQETVPANGVLPLGAGIRHGQIT